MTGYELLAQHTKPGWHAWEFLSFVGGDVNIPSAGATYTDHDTVLAVQTALKGRGFDPGKLDGIYGSNTARAIRALQASIGAPQLGVIDYGVLLLLSVPAPTGARATAKNDAQDLPTDGRPAKGWSQPQPPGTPAPASGVTLGSRPLWLIGVLGGLGLLAVGTGIVFLVKKRR